MKIWLIFNLLDISTQKLDEKRLKEDIIKATIENAKDEIQVFSSFLDL